MNEIIWTGIRGFLLFAWCGGCGIAVWKGWNDKNLSGERNWIEMMLALWAGWSVASGVMYYFRPPWE